MKYTGNKIWNFMEMGIFGTFPANLQRSQILILPHCFITHKDPFGNIYPKHPRLRSQRTKLFSVRSEKVKPLKYCKIMLTCKQLLCIIIKGQLYQKMGFLPFTQSLTILQICTQLPFVLLTQWYFSPFEQFSFDSKQCQSVVP